MSHIETKSAFADQFKLDQISYLTDATTNDTGGSMGQGVRWAILVGVGFWVALAALVWLV